MTTKTAYYDRMAEEAAKQVTGSHERWTAFLTSAARLYKYPYPEQLMIFIQRPDATACVEYDLWNENMNRYVKRGSKAIVLVDMSGEQPRLRYIFDVSDTGTRRHSRSVKLWTMEKEHIEPIQDTLEKSFGAATQDGLDNQILDVANKLANEYWNDHKRQILDIVAGYDEFNIEVSFKKAASISIAYSVFTRTVGEVENYFEHEDFLDIFDFNTQAAANVLGTAVSEMSAQVFREIEKTIRNYERNQEAERSQNYDRDDLQNERGLSDSRHSARSTGNKTAGQVWQNEESVPSGKQHTPLQSLDSDGETVPSPTRDSRDSDSTNGADDDRIAENESGAGQEHKSNGLDTAYEYVESTSRGSRDDGAYQQLTLDLIPSEEAQIRLIDKVEREKLPAFSFMQDEIDHILQLGSNADHGRMSVVIDFMKQKPMEDLVESVKNNYRGGYGLKEEKSNVNAWFDEDGIHFARGITAEKVHEDNILSWESATERIGELLEQGQYATNVELAESVGYERKKLAEGLWYIYHDLADDAREMDVLPSLEMEVRGFPSAKEALATKLTDDDFRKELQGDYREFMAKYRENRDILRFRYHKVDDLQRRLLELDLPLLEYRSDMTTMPDIRPFITDDEINKALATGSGFAGGKSRIVDFWQESHNAKEKADYLKEQYGIGGRSPALSGATGSGEDHDAKGLRYKKTGCEDICLTWAQAASRIDKLMREDKYLTDKEKAEREAIKETHKEIATDTVEADEEIIETVEPMEEFVADTEQISDGWNYKVGDTVYLDDTAFIVEQIGNYDVKLRGPGLFYPIIRAESRERLADLLDRDARNGGLRVTPIYTEKPVTEPVSMIPAMNFHITDDVIGEGGPKQKFARNIEAIKTIQMIETENRNATLEEQEILSNYVG